MTQTTMSSKRTELVYDLFNFSHGKYVLKNPDDVDVAKFTVPDHGICLECGRRSITGGCCTCCGANYKLRLGNQDIYYKGKIVTPSLVYFRGNILKNARVILKDVKGNLCSKRKMPASI